jgi:hypothetical protein
VGVREVVNLIAKLTLDDKEFTPRTKEAAKSSKAMFDSLLQGVGISLSVAGAITVMKKTFEFAKEGAQLELLESRFDRLSKSIGTTSDALLDDLRVATRGMYSDAELMKGATDLMALGLAKTQDKVIRLSKVMSGLNMDMNQLVLTLTNQTTMRFDALGVSVDGFKEKVKALEAQGMSANDAFNEAFLRQAEDQLKKVGEAADTSAGSFMQFEAVIKNNMDSAKRSLADFFAPALKWLTEGMKLELEYRDALKQANEELYNQHMVTLIWTDEMLKAAQAQMLLNSHLEAEQKYLGDQAVAMQVATDAVTTYGMKNEDLVKVIGGVTEENKRYLETTDLLRKSQIELGTEKEKLIKQGYSEESKAVQDVNGKMAENAEKMAENRKKHQEWINAKIGDLLLMKLSVDGLTNSELSYYLAFMTQSGQMKQTDAALALSIVGDTDRIAKGFDNAKESVDNFHHHGLYPLMERYQRALQQSKDTIHYTYTITGTGSFPKVPSRGSSQTQGFGYDNNPGVDAEFDIFQSQNVRSNAVVDKIPVDTGLGESVGTPVAQPQIVRLDDYQLDRLAEKVGVAVIKAQNNT